MSPRRQKAETGKRKTGIEKRRTGGFRSPVFRLLFSVFCLLVLCGSGLAQSAPARQGRARERIDLLVASGTVVTMDPQRRVLEDGAVAVRGDKIVAVGSRAE